MNSELPKSPLLFIVGMSGSGKDTAADYLVREHACHKVISYTTRPMRDGERQGSHHHHITIGALGGDPIFWTTMHDSTLFAQTIFGGHWYWTTREDILSLSADRHPVIYIIDEEGLRSIMENKSTLRWLEHNFSVWFLDISRRTTDVEAERTLRDAQRNRQWYERHIVNKDKWKARHLAIYNDYTLDYLYSALDAVYVRLHS